MKPTTRIKGVILDMDGTLIDSLFFFKDFWKSVGESYLGKKDFKPDEAIDKKMRTSIYVKALRMIAEEYHITDGRFFEEYIEYLNDFYRYRVSAKPGAFELLSFFKEQGIAVCVASASEMKHLEIALTACNLREYIPKLHSCADMGFGKDRPDIFLKAAGAMGLSPEEVCVVEDSFLALETAKSAGFFTVGVYDENNYDQERLRAASEIYLGKGETLADLIKKIKFDS